jgi:hypothetical protein
MRHRHWIFAGCLVTACAGSRSMTAEPIEALGEVRTGFSAGSTGFEFVFFPDAGQSAVGMHLVERDSAERLYGLADARPDQRLRVRLTGVVDTVTVHAHDEPPLDLPRIRVHSYQLAEGLVRDRRQ